MLGFIHLYKVTIKIYNNNNFARDLIYAEFKKRPMKLTDNLDLLWVKKGLVVFELTNLIINLYFH